MTRTTIIASVFLALSLCAGPAAGDAIFLEAGGMVVGESEHWHARGADTSGDLWQVVPDENAGAGTYSNARGDSYVQILPDEGDGRQFGATEGGAWIEYVLRIATTGTYRLWPRWDGIGGGSDSLFASITELADGSGGAADWYEFAGNQDYNFASNPWDGNAGFELDSAGVGSPVAATWDIASAGDYTLRFFKREDGASLDAWVFQLDSMAAPTGDGPAESTYIPEPAALAILAAGSLVAVLRRRR